MDANIAASLRSNFGFTSFRLGQAEAIQSLLNNQHTLVVMPTGAGKSLIYQLASLHLPGLTLVVSPLIALMKDQVDSLVRHHIPAAFINSALPVNEQNRRLEILAKGGYHIVYIAPERLRSAPFYKALRHQKVSLLAVDEAHCISEWGHDFRPDYLHIATARAALGNPLTVALTATATPQVQDDIVRLLSLPSACRIVTGFNRPNLTFEVRYAASLPAKLQAVRELIANSEDGATIVYVGTRRDAEEMAEFLRQVARVPAEHYHAGLEAGERSRIQEAFLGGDLPVVVATNAFGMGIDRPDVRQVVHYAMPGSLEAYYQEAGRAGRDGHPARAVLLYAPEDRALQEYFIENSAITSGELRALYEALRIPASIDSWMATDDFSRSTGLPEVKVRVGLAELERCGAVERLGDEGTRMLLHRGKWNEQKIQSTATRIKEHQRHRTAQLERMVIYAEANTCRRRILLVHFGDHGPAEAPECCDNCRVQQPTLPPDNDVIHLEQSQRVALILLDTIRRMKIRVGREKLAQILKGSRAVDIKKFHYDQNTYYGRLAVFRQWEIEELVEQLIQLGYLKVIGGKYPVISLTALGEAAIQGKSAIPLRLPRQIPDEEVAHKKAERAAGSTLEYTAQLFSQGHSLEQIARQRGLSLNTIYNHLARLIAAGDVQVEAVVPADVRQQIETAIQRVGSVDYLAPIKALLPEEISYGIICCVVEGLKLPPAGEDPIIEFLSRPHPRPLPGTWQAGWALDFHSRFAGAEWKRSVVGELAYRLKYEGDLSALPPLVEHTLALLAEHPELAQVDAIVPVPPSTPRPLDPVSLFAKALAENLRLAVLPALVKTRQTALQKELHSLAQKRANVAGAFAVQGKVSRKRLLVVDDLFDSGATLEEITRQLHRAGAARVCVLTL
ncbi:MAG TPA: RecQ family ATP-dependent DNA helicase, partial [Anaerolineales bacterium]|nr:RecQ family ATP-dependent DNA helicase [Anaerolineales bacterium]